MYKLFDKQNIVSYALVTLVYIGIVYKTYELYLTSKLVEDGSEVLNAVFNLQGKIPSIIAWLFPFVVLLVSISYSRIFRSVGLMSKSSILPVFLLLCHLTIVVTFPIQISDIIILAFLHVLILNLINSVKLNNTTIMFFRVGLLYSLVVFFATKAIILFIPVLLTLNFYGKKPVNDFMAFVLGIIFFIYILLSCLFLFDRFDILQSFFISFLNFKYSFITLPYLFCLILFSLEVLVNLGKINLLNINSRMLFSFLVSLVFISITFLLFFSFHDSKIAILPAYIGSYYFYIYLESIRKKRIKSLYLILFLVLAIINIFVI